MNECVCMKVVESSIIQQFINSSHVETSKQAINKKKKEKII